MPAAGHARGQRRGRSRPRAPLTGGTGGRGRRAERRPLAGGAAPPGGRGWSLSGQGGRGWGGGVSMSQRSGTSLGLGHFHSERSGTSLGLGGFHIRAFGNQPGAGRFQCPSFQEVAWDWGISMSERSGTRLGLGGFHVRVEEPAWPHISPPQRAPKAFSSSKTPQPHGRSKFPSASTPSTSPEVGATDLQEKQQEKD